MFGRLCSRIKNYEIAIGPRGKLRVVAGVGSGRIGDESHRDVMRGAGRFRTRALPGGHPFYKLENVLLSPHCADHTPDWLDNAMQFFHHAV
jgi:hypothetical protein